MNTIIYIAEAKELEDVGASSTVMIEVVETPIIWTKERIEEEIRNTFPEEPDLAVAIARAESGLKTVAYNPEWHRGCQGSYGVMQLSCLHYKKDPSKLKDVAFNLEKARQVYDESKKRTGNGWLPWGAYTNGSYKKYL